jgi:hypothetical protein
MLLCCYSFFANSSRPVSWGSSKFHGLSSGQFVDLVNSVIANTKSSASGQVSHKEAEVVFEPQEALSKGRNAKLDRITKGEVLYIDFSELIGSHPSQFQNVGDAKASLGETNSSLVYFSGESAISLSWIKTKLNAIASDCYKEGHAGLSVSVPPFKVMHAYDCFRVSLRHFQKMQRAMWILSSTKSLDRYPTSGESATMLSWTPG